MPTESRQIELRERVLTITQEPRTAYRTRVGGGYDEIETTPMTDAIMALFQEELILARIDELDRTFRMNGWHQGDWEQSIRNRLIELAALKIQGGKNG